MADQQKSSWKPGKRDMLFLGIVAVVVITLVLGSGERKTTPVPSDSTHQAASSMAECMTCHGQEGARPQPKGHIQGGQCFQCHLQPDGWSGAPK